MDLGESGESANSTDNYNLLRVQGQNTSRTQIRMGIPPEWKHNPIRAGAPKLQKDLT